MDAACALLALSRRPTNPPAPLTLGLNLRGAAARQEAWYSFRKGTEEGLISTRKELLRNTVVCVHEQDAMFKDDVANRWADCDVERARESLSEKWVQVFDPSDKVLQLQKLKHLEFIIRRFYIKQIAARSTQGGARPPSARRAVELAAAAQPAGGGITNVTGLEELLSSLGLQDNLAAAAEWCDSIGAESVDDLKDEDYAERLAARLELKEIKAKKLVKAIKAYCSEK